MSIDNVLYGMNNIGEVDAAGFDNMEGASGQPSDSGVTIDNANLVKYAAPIFSQEGVYAESRTAANTPQGSAGYDNGTYGVTGDVTIDNSESVA